jgi:hypothetical protein
MVIITQLIYNNHSNTWHNFNNCLYENLKFYGSNHLASPTADCVVSFNDCIRRYY